MPGMDTKMSAEPNGQSATAWLLANSGLSNAQLGRALGVTGRAVSHWAAGTRSLTGALNAWRPCTSWFAGWKPKPPGSGAR